MRSISRVACIADRIQAITNCIASGNKEWEEKHGEVIDTIMETAPSGSGFDNGTKLTHRAVDKLVFSTAFHHMDEGGSYDGWTEHDVVVTPAFRGFSLRVTGRDRNGIKDYIAETFHSWLSEEVHPGTGVKLPDSREDSLTNGCRVLLSSPTAGTAMTSPGRFVLCERDDRYQPFVVWWQNAATQELVHGDYHASLADAAMTFAERVRRG